VPNSRLRSAIRMRGGEGGRLPPVSWSRPHRSPRRDLVPGSNPTRVGSDTPRTAPRSASLLAFCSALAVLDVERSSPDANITDFGDAIWWAVTTMTTVGYGDRYPVTGVGRMVALALMVGGIALVGTVTATLASWSVETVAAEKEQAESLHATVQRLEAKVDLLATEPRRDLDRTSLHGR
jgi:Ion channel